MSTYDKSGKGSIHKFHGYSQSVDKMALNEPVTLFIQHIIAKCAFGKNRFVTVAIHTKLPEVAVLASNDFTDA